MDRPQTYHFAKRRDLSLPPDRYVMKVRMLPEQRAWLEQQASGSGGWGAAWVVRALIDAARLKEPVAG